MRSQVRSVLFFRPAIVVVWTVLLRWYSRCRPPRHISTIVGPISKSPGEGSHLSESLPWVPCRAVHLTRCHLKDHWQASSVAVLPRNYIRLLNRLPGREKAVVCKVCEQVRSMHICFCCMKPSSPAMISWVLSSIRFIDIALLWLPSSSWYLHLTGSLASSPAGLMDPLKSPFSGETKYNVS